MIFPLDSQRRVLGERPGWKPPLTIERLSGRRPIQTVYDTSTSPRTRDRLRKTPARTGAEVAPRTPFRHDNDEFTPGLLRAGRLGATRRQADTVDPPRVNRRAMSIRLDVPPGRGEVCPPCSELRLAI